MIPGITAGNPFVGPYYPKHLFLNGSDGFWLDPAGHSSLWVDEARTLNPTAPGDVVWWIDDMSGNDNHFAAVSSAARGRLLRWPASAVMDGYPRNALIRTEELGAWSKTSGEVSVSAGVDDPDGGNTAFRVVGLTGLGRLALTNLNFLASTNYKVTVWARSVTGPLTLQIFLGGASSTKAITAEWSLVTFEITSDVSSLNIFQFRLADAGKTIDLYRPSAEDTARQGAYQRVGAGIWDVSEEGQADCWGILEDGVTTQYVSTRGIPVFTDDKMRSLVGQTRLAPTGFTAGTIITNALEAAANDAVRLFSPATQVYSLRYRTASTNAEAISGAYPNLRSAIMDSKVQSATPASVQLQINNVPPITGSAAVGGTINNGTWCVGGLRDGTNLYNGIIWGVILVASEPSPGKWEIGARQWLSNHNMGGILG